MKYLNLLFCGFALTCAGSYITGGNQQFGNCLTAWGIGIAVVILSAAVNGDVRKTIDDIFKGK